MNAAAWLSGGALILSGLAAVYAGLAKRSEVRVTDDSNLRDDQREFIAMVRQDNAELRERVAAQARHIHALEAALRAAGIPLPT